MNTKKLQLIKNKVFQINIYLLAIILFGCTINTPNNPTLTTNPATNITSNSALSGGNITNNGNATITETGICLSEYPFPNIYYLNIPSGSTSSSFTCSITGLNPNTFYYIRSYALNSSGLYGYGNQQTFYTTPISSTPGANLTDIDGNTYQTIVLGNGQTWMQKNLNVSKYRNGDTIPQVQDPTTWANLTTGAWCYYDNITANGTVYGKLYNWYAVNDSRGLAPQGWHIPVDQEWMNLINYLGGENVAGGKLKTTGNQYWANPNNYATNEIGFSALPGGERNDATGNFSGNIGYSCCWWSSTEFGNCCAAGYDLINSNGIVGIGYRAKKRGYSLRCIKD
jgi:uncharacterized protein (TIGR02145 family)